MKLYNGKCEVVLKKLTSDSFDALVTDPPSSIGFKDHDWDHDKGGFDIWVSWMTGIMTECYRVMKPGAYGVVWALPKRCHWMGSALEKAGFEVRDVITHVMGDGIPKSRNIYKDLKSLLEDPKEVENFKHLGTGLKPAAEFWFLIRKPMTEASAARNVLQWKTGGINIEDCRIKSNSDKNSGRWPSNLIFSHSDECTDEACDSECPCLLLNQQSGIKQARKALVDDKRHVDYRENSGSVWVGGLGRRTPENSYNDSGGASRFFYCIKPTKKERTSNGKIENDHPTIKSIKLMRYLTRLVTPKNGLVLDPFMGSGTTGLACLEEEFDFIGIEEKSKFFAISQKRLTFLKNELSNKII